jgi:hypothetical protein
MIVENAKLTDLATTFTAPSIDSDNIVLLVTLIFERMYVCHRMAAHYPPEGNEAFLGIFGTPTLL